MKHCLVASLFLLVIVLPALALGDGGQKDRELDAFLQKVEQEAASVESFSSNFVQTRYLAIFPQPVKFSGRLVLAREDFDFELLPGPALAFAPRQSGAGDFIQKIRVLFDKELLQPLEVEISEPGGDRTLISFTDYQRNISPEPELFSGCQTDR